MTRMTFGRILAAGAVAIALALPTAGPVRAETPTHDGSVVIQTEADLTIPAGTHRDVVVVIAGDVAIQGEVETVVVVDGTATLTGARVETLVVVGGAVQVGAGSTVDQVRTVESTYEVAPGAVVGSQTSVEPAMLAAGLAPIAFAIWLGFALAYVLTGLVVAAIAGGQLRRAGGAITGRPGAVALGALGVLIGLPLLIAALAVTVIGIPTALVVAMVVLPLVWFVGSVAVAVRIGDWMLLKARGRVETSHPIVAAFIGIVVVGVLSVIPLVGFLIGLVGAGAVMLVAWDAAFGDARRTAPPTVEVGPAAA
jgi:hypothetical protein